MRHWGFILCMTVAVLAMDARSAENDVLVPEGESAEVLEGVVWAPVGPIYSVAFSADGRTLASGGEDGTVRLWELDSGREVRRLKAHEGAVESVAFSADGRLLASGGEDGRVLLWEAGNGRREQVLKGHEGAVESVAFSADGRLLASGGEDGTVRLWEVGSGREVRGLRGHKGPVWSVVFSADGRMLVSGGEDGTVRMWEVGSGHEARSLEDEAGPVWSVAFGADGRTLASGGKDGTVRLWAVDSGQVVWRLGGHSGPVWSVAFGADGRTLASSGEDGTVRLWEVGRGREVRRLKADGNGVLAVAFSADGRTLASGGGDGTVKLWEVASGREVRRLEGHNFSVESVAFSADGRMFASGGWDGTVTLWEVASGREVWRLAGHVAPVWSVAFSADGRTLASGGGDGVVRLWEVGSGREVWKLEGHEGSVWSVAFSADGRMLASGGKGGVVRLWEVGSGREVRRLERDSFSVESVAFSADGRTVVSAGDDLSVIQWEVGSGREVWRWGNFQQYVGFRWEQGSRQEARSPLEGRGRSLKSSAFNVDGRTLASRARDGKVKLWEMGSGREVWRLAHRGGVASVALSADGRTLASIEEDGRVRLWDVGSRREVGRLEGHDTGLVTSMALSADGRTLAVGGRDGRMRLWSSPVGHPLVELRVGGRQGWVGYRHGKGVLRRDDGHLLLRQREDGLLEAVAPPRPEVASRLSVSVSPGTAPGDFGEVGEFSLQLANANNAGRAYWIRVEPVELPAGLVLLPPPVVSRLEPGSAVTLRVGLSYLRPEGSAVRRNTRVLLKVIHAHGEGPSVEVPVRLRAPEVEVTGGPRVEGKTLAITVKNTGDQSSGALSLAGMFRAQGVNEQASPQQKLEDLPPGVERTLALAIPLEVLEVGAFSFALTSEFERWPRTKAQTFENVQVPSPYTLYGALMAGALLMGSAVYYARVYRNPVVVQTTASPLALRRYSLFEMRAADLALQRARRRDSTVIAAGIPLIRWERVLRGAGTATEAVESFAEAIGGRLGAPLSSAAWGLSLPPLRLRFAQETAVVVVDGSRLESGEAERHMADMFQDGKGPRQVLVLDRTVAQNAVQVLQHVPHVRAVVLTAERLRDLLVAEEPVRLLEATITGQVAVSELSPYQVAGAVKNERFFFGRERELRDIVERSLRNFLLVGQRQMGKSTLLMAVKRSLEARAGLDVHYVELADADLHRHLARHRKLMPVDGTAPPRFEDVAAGEPSRPRVWLIDEVDDFVTTDAKAGYPLVRVMRALAEEGRAYFILAGFWDLYRAVVLDEKQPLRNFGEHRRLEPLEPRAALALVTEPMAALGLTWDEPSTTEYLLARTGLRANLLVLACKGLVETLARETRTLSSEHLERVLREDRDLRDQCRRWRGDSPLHRAVVRQALLLGNPTREEVRVALKARGADVSASDFDEAMDHRELSYVLVPDADGRLSCPVPLMRGYIESERGLEQGLSEDLEDLRRGLIAVPPPAA